MISREAEEIKNGIKSLNDALIKLERTLKNENNDDYWNNAIGLNASIPGEEYDWVLVKIRTVNYGDPIRVPHIAKFGKDGWWWPLEWDDHYESEKVPFEVVSWKPIPGDNYHELSADGKIVGGYHSYD